MKSKKRSATRHDPPEPITFFVDRSLSKLVGEMLREAGVPVELHDDHFRQDARDEEWIPVVGARGWVVLRASLGAYCGVWALTTVFTSSY
jgi:hypothetical protein